MSKVVEFVDWDDDFRYAEERRRVTEVVRNIAAERGFEHAVVQCVRPFFKGAPPSHLIYQGKR